MTQTLRCARFARLALAFALLAPLAATAQTASGTAPAAVAPAAATAFAKLQGLVGEWIDTDGSAGMKGQVVVTYRLTGAGSAVVETLFPGTAHEMVTVYTKDGNDVVLTHYCAEGNQPRMRAKTVAGNAFDFAFDGGTNFDPAKDSHMHTARLEVVGPNEIRGEWHLWADGKPAEHVAHIHATRKAG